MKSIIDRFSEVLPASDVPFGRLHRRVTKEKLNLLEFPSSIMTEAGAGVTTIVRRETVNADSLGILFYRIPGECGVVGRTPRPSARIYGAALPAR